MALVDLLTVRLETKAMTGGVNRVPSSVPSSAGRRSTPFYNFSSPSSFWLKSRKRNRKAGKNKPERQRERQTIGGFKLLKTFSISFYFASSHSELFKPK